MLILLFIVGVIIVGGWIGLRILPKPFPPFPQATPSFETVPLPDDLPEPVYRYFKTTIGDQIPVIHSAVFTGRAYLRPFGVSLPSRFRIIHCAGQGYRHYIEVVMFGIPLMKINERYLDGIARMELPRPIGTVDNAPKINAAANQGLWAESVWLPGILVTDPRVRWEAIDETTARLIVPFGAEEQSFTFTFDAETGLKQSLETMRYRDADSENTIRWFNAVLGWKTFHGMTIPTPATVQWMDQKQPWSHWEIEDVAYNVDVTDYIRQRGA